MKKPHRDVCITTILIACCTALTPQRGRSENNDITVSKRTDPPVTHQRTATPRDAGGVREWQYDANGNGRFDTGDRVYQYQVMGRAGTGLYAIDVTDRSAPIPLWKIRGTALDTKPGGRFRDLAQTWSPPQLATIRWCAAQCIDREVLFLAGGYDPVHDTARLPTADSRGNAVYMLDAISGRLLWSAGRGSLHDIDDNTMKNSIVAAPAVIDSDGDKRADTLFVIDILGNLFRFDFSPKPTSPATFAAGGRIAALGDSGMHFRRFFNTPDIAYFLPPGSAPFLSIAVASGNAASTGEQRVDDNLFVLFDRHALTRPANYRYVDNTGVITPSLLSVAGAPSISRYGWHLPLTGSGEKGLSQTVTFNGRIFFSTFLPPAVATATGGTGRFYILDALTGATALSESRDGRVALTDGHAGPNHAPVPFRRLLNAGIPTTPELLFDPTPDLLPLNNDAEPVGTKTLITPCVGGECLAIDIQLPLHKIYWRTN